MEALATAYSASRRRLLVLGYNATLTTAVEAPRQPKKHFDQIQVGWVCVVVVVWGGGGGRGGGRAWVGPAAEMMLVVPLPAHGAPSWLRFPRIPERCGWT
jgi:hypothetical protein